LKAVWWADPRTAVLVILGAIVLIGVSRRWLHGARGRRAVERLADSAVTVDEIAAVAAYGREGILELFRLLETAPDRARRQAAGAALARLWAADELIAEEEKAIVTRGVEIAWKARRRYPRGMHAPIPIEVHFGVPFLSEDGTGVKPANLEWSYRVTGTERASLEVFSAWDAGAACVRIEILPEDFPTNGPHQLSLQLRVRAVGLTDSWEHNLPHVPFRFEFDPLLKVEALLALPDDSRAEVLAQAVRLEPVTAGDKRGAEYLDWNEAFALKAPPAIVVATPLPCDLAHAVEVEIDGVAGRFPAGWVVLSNQGLGGPAGKISIPLGPIAGVPPEVIDRPGERLMRAVLTADPQRGWADPDVRSLWPGTIVTNWCPVRFVRR
jgi:hypothetical protein